ncbi:2-polyprenyl-3-methyl-6-methoxy-1,4-benzoquinone monooxygenase [Candidatus Coxiella mudrowiae]|uniref:3-demethoxyubiquinol 3-hydroxylase n=1 Tax=Candidatus Coxiella mudrowiae TaxID=2054173 RepID=A0ABM5UTC7_9COXI|nr:2-polyprenyl-3-methyl-6-methoxy-1,4-benzoquinone monooxygenase [Candidatus Coxiella mudrowiae]AKQ33181.1 2-nonaprenyl-3-methyl-6-methoxy-1,4-benzoquinol hydroxylase [Candidatus Coxiella mudrowiae]
MRNNLRHYSVLDEVILQYHNFVETVFNQSRARRQSPAKELSEPVLTHSEKQNSIGCMRVNHSGEICAQALYRGQMILSQNSAVQSMLATAVEEETDHLAWCKDRIEELGGYTSYLNIFWYSNAFLIGLLAGASGDLWSLGFVEETEKQVEAHLENHLHKLSSVDVKSRKIVEQMQKDEVSHGQKAKSAGAKELPYTIKKLMGLHAKVMTTLAYWI